jgi:hypothetical protein
MYSRSFSGLNAEPDLLAREILLGSPWLTEALREPARDPKLAHREYDVSLFAGA